MLANFQGLIYGTLVVATLLDAETAGGESYLRVAASVVAAMILYWVAHTYATFTGERLAEGRPFELGALAATGRHELAVVLGAAVPLVVLAFCWIAGVALGSGLTAAVWSAGAVLAGLEVAAAVRTELEGRELAAQVIAGLVLMAIVVLLRRILH